MDELHVVSDVVRGSKDKLFQGQCPGFTVRAEAVQRGGRQLPQRSRDGSANSVNDRQLFVDVSCVIAEVRREQIFIGPH